MSKKVMPRLKQPLFSKEHGKLYSQAIYDPVLHHFLRAYDAIYNLLYYPKDMSTEEILQNGEVNLQALGHAIEQAFGSDIFTTKEVDDGQLSFDFGDEVK